MCNLLLIILLKYQLYGYQYIYINNYIVKDIYDLL